MQLFIIIKNNQCLELKNENFVFFYDCFSVNDSIKKGLRRLVKGRL